MKLIIKIFLPLAILALMQCGIAISQNLIKTQTIKMTTNTDSLTHSNNAVIGNNQFANNLFEHYIHSKEEANKNTFFSPFSIYSALAMTSEGAKNRTAQEIQHVLHLPKIDSIRQSGFESLINSINSTTTNYKLITANALWVEKEYKLLPKFLDITKQNYKASAENVDFVLQPETARTTINTWVENNTNNKIKELISKNDITKNTRLILTNTIYFKGEWNHKFETSQTKEADFIAINGTTEKVQMMHLQSSFSYYETEQVQILEMPYKNSELSMIIILPKTGNSVQSISNPKNFNEFLNFKANHELTQVSLPKFKLEKKYFLKDDLSKMGMTEPFTGNADFSGMTGHKELQISQVIHQTFVEVNEDGTEAAAATAVDMRAGGMPRKVEPKQFNANHPFIFVIRHNATGALLFMGVVNNPNEK